MKWNEKWSGQDGVEQNVNSETNSMQKHENHVIVYVSIALKTQNGL